VNEFRHADRMIPGRGNHGRRSCPPHGPLMSRGSREGGQAIECLNCGLLGSELEDFGVTRAAPEGEERGSSDE
jgi:hypothetical protein